MIDILFLWQDAGADVAASGTSPLLWPFMLMAMAIMYFFFIRPSVKEQKELKEFSDGLKKGSKVITVGGIHGTITELNETSASLLIAAKTVITVQRSSISLEMTKSLKSSAKEPEKAN